MSTYGYRSGFGNAVAGEHEVTFYPGEPLEDDYGVLYLHGSGATYASYSQATRFGSSQLAAYITKSGLPGVSLQIAGNQYAADLAIAKCVEAVPWLGSGPGTSGLGCDTSKVHVVGGSMGGGTAIRLAIEYPELVASITALIPMSNIPYMYANNILGLQGAVGAAWGVTYPTPLPAGADLIGQAGIIGANDIPVHLWYDEADPYIREVDVLAMATAIGDSADVFKIDPADPGHTETAIKWVVDHGLGKAQTTIDMMKANGAA